MPWQSAAVMDKNSKIINDKERKTKRWLEHLTENPSNPVNEMEIELPHEIEEIDTSEPSRAETKEKLRAPSIATCKQSCLKLTFMLRPKSRRSWT